MDQYIVKPIEMNLCLFGQQKINPFELHFVVIFIVMVKNVRIWLLLRFRTEMVFFINVYIHSNCSKNCSAHINKNMFDIIRLHCVIGCFQHYMYIQCVCLFLSISPPLSHCLLYYIFHIPNSNLLS